MIDNIIIFIELVQILHLQMKQFTRKFQSENSTFELTFFSIELTQKIVLSRIENKIINETNFILLLFEVSFAFFKFN